MGTKVMGVKPAMPTTMAEKQTFVIPMVLRIAQLSSKKTGDGESFSDMFSEGVERSRRTGVN